MIALLRRNHNFALFIVACAQSQLGNGAAYVALLLVAYHRLHSGWAVALVLLSDFLPGIVLAPMFGVLADRIPRRRLAISGDLCRAVAFLGIAVIPSFLGTVALALVVGVGTAAFRPAASCALRPAGDGRPRGPLARHRLVGSVLRRRPDGRAGDHSAAADLR